MNVRCMRIIHFSLQPAIVKTRNNFDPPFASRLTRLTLPHTTRINQLAPPHHNPGPCQHPVHCPRQTPVRRWSIWSAPPFHLWQKNATFQPTRVTPGAPESSTSSSSKSTSSSSSSWHLAWSEEIIQSISADQAVM